MDKLRNLKYTRTGLELMQERRDRLYSVLTGSRGQTGDRSGVTVSQPDPDKVGKLLAAIEALDDRILQYTLDVEAATVEAERLIEPLPPAQRMIVQLRYLEGLPWKKVAVSAGYSVDNCFKLHAAAIQRLPG